VRQLGERRDFSPANLERLRKLAADPSPSVRLAVAVACRQLVSSSLTVNTDINTAAPVESILIALIQSSADAKDPLIPYMIWMASEPLLAHDPRPGLQWLADNGAANMPLSGILARKAMRRICDTHEAAKLDLVVNFLSQVAGRDSALTLAAIDGLIEGQKAKPLVPSVDTEALFARLNAGENAQIKKRAEQLGTLWGNAGAIRQTLGAVNDADATPAHRAQAIAAARQLKSDAAREALLKLIAEKNPESLVIDAIRGLGEIGGDTVGREVLQSWRQFTPAARAAAAEVLVSRGRWAVALLSALETKIISPSELSMTAVRALGDSGDEIIRQRALQVIGRIRPASADKQPIIAEKKAMILAAGPADMRAGRELAIKHCLVCHKLNDEGGEVGPDLTGVGRADLETLLVNVIDPNQVIGKGYENVEVETKDDRIVSGRLIEDTDTRVVLLSAGPKEEVIAKSDIERMRVSELSVMPEGLEQIPDEDFRNMILFILNAP
jgi:putative heme-binding domain-containing protein